jgi:hypothetical protein
MLRGCLGPALLEGVGELDAKLIVAPPQYATVARQFFFEHVKHELVAYQGAVQAADFRSTV